MRGLLLVDQNSEAFMAYCDFCTCGDCQEGTRYLRHAPTVDGRWICDVCWGYEVCIDGKRAAFRRACGEKSRGIRLTTSRHLGYYLIGVASQLNPKPYSQALPAEST